MKERILDAIKKLTAETGWPPTERDIARATGLSRSTVHVHVAALTDAGRLIRSMDRRRLIRLTEAHVAAPCAICGTLLAGYRSDARYCSGACRAEASRLRRAA